MLADELDYVIGVDTHLDEHVLAVVASPSGAVVAKRGYASALAFALEAGSGARVWAIEGTGSYGAGLARYLVGRGETVLETGRVPQTERRLRGKDDALDAVRTARAALAGDTLALPRVGERREALRPLDEPGIGPIVAAQLSSPGHTADVCAPKPALHGSPASHRSQHRAAKRRDIDSAAAATANSTAPSTPPSSTAANTIAQPATTSNGASPKAKPAATQHASSSATSPATSTDYCNRPSR